MRKIVEGAYNQALDLLRRNLDKLHLLASVLLEREVLDGDQMNRVLRGEKLEPLKPVPSEPVAPAEAPAPRSPEEPRMEAGGAPQPRPAEG